MKKPNAEAIICGETYDVQILEGPNVEGLCAVDVFFDYDDDFVERLAVHHSNIFPKDENAISFLMQGR